MASRLVVGLGNRQRGDDAAGLLVADLLRAEPDRTFDVMVSRGEMTELLGWFRSYDEVILVDAVCGAEPGLPLRWDCVHGPLPFAVASAGTHGLGAPQAIELARVLGGLPARLTVYGIPGLDFRIGAAIGAVTLNAIAAASRAILEEIARAPDG